MANLFIDTETRSGEPLTNGVYRYVEDPEFMVMIITWALDDGPIETIDRTAAVDQHSLDRLMKHLRDPSVTVVAHNAQFDRVVLRASGIDIPIERWHCTMARAMAHSLPGSLDKLCTIMKVPLEKSKDKRGREYIRLFCMPRPKGSSVRWCTQETHPNEWAGFLAYAGGDIEALRVLHKKLPRWNYGRRELAVYHLDQRINDRGIRVDTALAGAALDAADAEQRRLGADTRRLTGDAVASATQRDALIRHILAVYGIDLPDLQAGTLERRLEDEAIPDDVKELLRIRLMVSKTSTSKYKTLLRCVCKDERLRGLLAFCGAMRTGRWSGRLFQPQNLMRTPKYLAKIIDMAIESILDGSLPMWASNIMEVLAAAIRGALVASPGKKLICADLSNIEGRFLAWLAGEWWRIKAFEELDAGRGEDLYILSYAQAFGVSIEAVKEDYEAGGNWRLIGKVMELSLQYGGSVRAFTSMAKMYGVEIEEEKARGIVKAWRRANPAIVKFWYALNDAMIQAIALNGTEVICGRLLLVKTGAWLKIRLPSGRYLSYPHPEYSMQWALCFNCGGEGKIFDTEYDDVAVASVCPQCDGRGKVKREVLSYMGVNQYTRKWERIQTHGPKAAENATQGGSRDVFAHGMFEAENEGFEVLLGIHDELVTEADDNDGLDAKRLAACMTRVPEWALGLPLAAQGYAAKRYRKG